MTVLIMILLSSIFYFFFFNDTATTEIYTLSLHDALPISTSTPDISIFRCSTHGTGVPSTVPRSEEHTSELQSHLNLVCRLLLEKKKNINSFNDTIFENCLNLQIMKFLRGIESGFFPHILR